jgi:hypothetical protein
MTDQEEPKEPFGARELREWRNARLADVRREYAEVTNRLWAGNGAGAIAAISLIASATHQGVSAPAWWLASPTAFLAALAALSVGSVARLLDLGNIVRNLEKAEGIMEVRIDAFRLGSHDAGLHWRDPRTVSAIIAAVLLVAGSGVGLAAIYGVAFHSPAATVVTKSCLKTAPRRP